MPEVQTVEDGSRSPNRLGEGSFESELHLELERVLPPEERNEVPEIRRASSERRIPRMVRALAKDTRSQSGIERGSDFEVPRAECDWRFVAFAHAGVVENIAWLAVTVDIGPPAIGLLRV